MRRRLETCPFPEMDPYQEGEDWGHFAAHWNVHVSLSIRNRLPEPYAALMQGGKTYEPAGEFIDRHISIFRRDDRQVISVVCLISPEQRQPGHFLRQRYLRRREKWLSEGVRLMEIDLLRGGEPMSRRGSFAKSYAVTTTYLPPQATRPTYEQWDLPRWLPKLYVPLPAGKVRCCSTFRRSFRLSMKLATAGR